MVLRRFVVLRKVHASLTVPMRGSAGTGLSEKEEGQSSLSIQFKADFCFSSKL